LEEIETRIRSNSNSVEELMIDPPAIPDDTPEKKTEE